MSAPAALVPDPPKPLDPLAHILNPGAVLRRVHSALRAPGQFNPGAGAPTRFAPVRDAAGDTVPTLYAAKTSAAAVAETILHDVPLRGGLLPADAYTGRAESALELRRELRLAMFMGPGLRRLGVAPHELTATDGDVYHRTVRWSQAAYEEGFDGVAWMSARENTSEAYVLFGDRVTAADLQLTAAGVGPFAPGTSGFEWLSGYCANVRVEVLLA